MKTILIVGHTGFIGRSFVRYLDQQSEEYTVIGISKEKTSFKSKYINIHEYTSIEEFNSNSKIDFVFFLAHAQNSKNPKISEDKLKANFIKMIKRNHIESPIILILSAGSGTEHFNSRVKFNEDIKKELNNKVIEIRSSIIASPGSTPYEIPYRCVKKLDILLSFPWYKNNVSITRVEKIMEIFQQILDGDYNSPKIPEFKTITYKDYILEIAKAENKVIRFIQIPVNEFNIVPYIVSKLTNMDYYLVRNLMQSLSVNSILE